VAVELLLPDNIDLIFVGKLVQGMLELSLTDVAERAHDITPDFNVHGCTD